jgi:hypothetical protein
MKVKITLSIEITSKLRNDFINTLFEDTEKSLLDDKCTITENYENTFVIQILSDNIYKYMNTNYNFKTFLKLHGIKYSKLYNFM